MTIRKALIVAIAVAAFIRIFFLEVQTSAQQTYTIQDYPILTPLKIISPSNISYNYNSLILNISTNFGESPNTVNIYYNLDSSSNVTLPIQTKTFPIIVMIPNPGAPPDYMSPSDTPMYGFALSSNISLPELPEGQHEVTVYEEINFPKLPTFYDSKTVYFLINDAICTAAQNTELLSRGNTFTYERYHIWESNDPNATPMPDVDFFARNNSVVTVKIENVSSTEVDVHITVQYQNGTQRAEFIRHDILTGYNEPTSMVFGDSRIPHNLDLIQNPQKQVDYTETRTYREIMRKVNVFSYIEDGWTMFDNTVYNVTATKKRCYDAQTGMFLESESELLTYNRNNINLNQTIHEFIVLKDTNVWVGPKFPSDKGPSDLFLPLLMAAVAIVVAFASLVYWKKRKERKRN